MVNLNDVTNVHFIGIAGAGMRAIANVFIEKGYHVSGSDLKASPITEQFAQKGARICIGQRPENLQDAQVVVISSAIRDTNVELAEARRRGIPVIHRSDALVHIMSWGKGISVAGAHGKTTTSSMLGQVFEECHQDPTIVIGGESVLVFDNKSRIGGTYVDPADPARTRALAAQAVVPGAVFPDAAEAGEAARALSAGQRLSRIAITTPSPASSDTAAVPP